MRPSGRDLHALRDITIETGVNAYAEGSCLITCGGTKVHCTASIQDGVPGWLKGQGKGWITAEYGMLPRSTHQRMAREAAKGKQSGRTVEISRLIGRSLRAVADLNTLGERMICVDCDVLQADGGTRTAAITGGYVALRLALENLVKTGELSQLPLTDYVAAISCGITENGPVADLDYAEDSAAIADGNYIMTGQGDIIEVQTTAEQAPIKADEFNALMALATQSIQHLITLQKEALAQEAN